ncbi:MAG: glycosyltransferase family 1 protein [Candidatus Hydrogenedentes bacterium]|nr:glycosyltransferase family 1 protein [Candidatus Hydrogenedentota bacterium]
MTLAPRGTDAVARLALRVLPGVLLRYMRRFALAHFPASICKASPALGGHELRCLDNPDALDEDLDGVLLLVTDPGNNPVSQWGAALKSRQCLYVFALGGTAGMDDTAPSPALIRYYHWAIGEDETIVPDRGDGSLAPFAWLSLYYPAGYDPVAHARALLLAGAPGSSLELLENIPAHLLLSDEAKGMAPAEHMLPYLLWDKAQGEHNRIGRFSTALDDFNKATTYLPGYAPAYECMALFWERLGLPARAQHLRRTLAFAQDAPYALPGGSPTVDLDVTYPKIDVKAALAARPRPLRLLYVMHAGSDYGGDLLFNGLCEHLGDANVVDFPWKPMLHGELHEAADGYPCTFTRPGKALPVQAVADQLKAGDFDLILLNDTLGALDRSIVELVMQCGHNTPVVLLDVWDQCGDYVDVVCARTPIAKLIACVKREYIAGATYHPLTAPLPFSYASTEIPAQVSYEHRHGLFWAGKLAYGDRRIKLEWLSRRRGLDIHRRMSQAEYQAAMRSALIGLSLFGNGFDTVRYWELPAHGVMLLAERPPIPIPNNFVDGQHAALFDDLPELVEKLDYYLAHPREARTIAEAGRKHLLKYHTDYARAEQFLQIVLDRL